MATLRFSALTPAAGLAGVALTFAAVEIGYTSGPQRLRAPLPSFSALDSRMAFQVHCQEQPLFRQRPISPRSLAQQANDQRQNEKRARANEPQKQGAERWIECWRSLFDQIGDAQVDAAAEEGWFELQFQISCPSSLSYRNCPQAVNRMLARHVQRTGIVLHA